MTTANKITIARILLIPVFVLFAVYYAKSIALGTPVEWLRAAAIGVFLAASISDGIDGYIARKYNQRSKLGRVLDPLADKALVLSAIITLSAVNWGTAFPVWFPILVIARDIVILSGAGIIHFLTGHVEVRPSWLGKSATVLQMAAIGWVMLGLKYHLWVIGAAGACVLLSGAGYIMHAIKELQKEGHGNAGI